MIAIINTYNKPQLFTILMNHPINSLKESFSATMFNKPITHIHYILRPILELPYPAYNYQDPDNHITIFSNPLKFIYSQHYLNLYTHNPNILFEPISLHQPSPSQLLSPFDRCCNPYYKNIIDTLTKYAIFKPPSNPLSISAQLFNHNPQYLLSPLYKKLQYSNIKFNFQVIKLT